jgi:SAM-dependent methyltransferase
MARNSQVLYAAALAALAAHARHWLDLGCGHQFVPDWVSADALATARARTTVVGIDGDLPSLRRHPGLTLKIAADIERLPLAGGTFDLVTANMVVEHVADPDRLFAEVARVLRPGGRFLVHTPNVHGYTTALARVIPSGMRPRVAGLLQGRRPEDVYPTHYRANSLRSLSALAARHGFDVERLDTVTSSAQLFRVPVAGWIEDRWLGLLSAGALARLRPCILAVFARRDPER